MADTDTDAEELVAESELLARYVLFSKWVRPSDQTVKQDAFVPHPHADLSVTRHIGLGETDLWTIGRSVADKRHRTLYGRADVYARQVRRHSLHVRAAPLDDNSNHANITGWPTDKASQKIIAQQLAADASFVGYQG